MFPAIFDICGADNGQFSAAAGCPWAGGSSSWAFHAGCAATKAGRSSRIASRPQSAARVLHGPRTAQRGPLRLLPEKARRAGFSKRNTLKYTHK